jgi:TolA-binding protein
VTLPRSAPKLDPLELSTRARRGELSPAERQELERALEANLTLRVAHRVGRDFDAALRIRPGDEAVLERATRAAIGRGAARRRRRPFVAVLGLAAALMLGSAGAAVRHGWKPLGASLDGLRNVLAGSHVELAPASRPKSLHALPNARASAASRPTANSVAMPPASPAPSATGSGALEASPSHATSVPSIGAGAPASKRSAERAATPVAAASEEGRGTETADAAALFRAAGAARHAGELELAKKLYASLQMSFPQAPEARVACVSLGKLWLAGGDARRAEREFARYLAAGGGALAEEALVGQAQSFAALGERGEERRVWLELLARFGSGVYAERARQRLDELSAADRSAL